MSQQFKVLDTYLRNNQYVEAAVLCAQLSAEHVTSLPLQLTLSQVYQRLGHFHAMLDTARIAVALDPSHVAAQMRLVESFLYCCEVNQALNCLETLEETSLDDPRLLQDIAHMYLQCAGHAQARRCYERAVQLQADHPQYLYNLAASCVTFGEIERAENLFNRVIELDANDAGAYLNRSMLKTWTNDNHHVNELRLALQRLPDGDALEVPLCFALAKEYEDLGESAKSFESLQRGASRRRSKLAYKVENDVAAMAQIQMKFNTDLFRQRPSRQVLNHAQKGEPAYFVLGLPRTGTTLVDRIVSSHSQVDSLGEINDFAFALMQLASGPGGKLDMIERSTHIDFMRLGEIYRHGILGYGPTAPHLINKMPVNFLYIGLIHLALPDAKIIHLRRHPLDACYAMYKTLFRMGYPFSYSLDDVGHYYLAYHRLMQHWRDVIPGSFLDIDYEELVADQEGVSRRMLDYCGLSWESNCLNFHKNATPSATASAAQVRSPVYRSSVQRWRQYETELAPLADFLTQHGIDCS